MSESDSDSSVEKVLGKYYSFIRNEITKDLVKRSPPSTSVVPDPGKKDVEVPPETVLPDTSPSTSVVLDSANLDKLNEMPKAANARYGKLSLEELNSIAERVKIFSEVGVVVPQKTVPCKNKSKPNNRKTQKIQPAAKKRKNTYGKGQVGTSCSSYGVKRCLCCNGDNDNILRTRQLHLGRDLAMIDQLISSALINVSATHQSPLRETPRHGLTTSTPSRSVQAESQESSPGNNSFDVSDIRVVTPDRNAQTDTQSEEHIMEYVNDLLGDTINSIEAEVEERYQRLNENRLAASDAISNAITVDLTEQMDFDHSVILVGESSPQPVTIDDSTVEVNEISTANSNKSPKKQQTVDLTEPSERNVAIVNKEGKNIQRNVRECPICVEELTNKDISATTCGHVFCTSCIRAAVKVSKLCPICRKKLTQSKIHRLYCLL